MAWRSGVASLPWQPCVSASARALRLPSKRLIETIIWEGQKQAFPKLVMLYNDPAARLSDKSQSDFARRARCEGGIRHDIGLSGTKSRGASAAAVPRLQEHGQALAVEAADSD